MEQMKGEDSFGLARVRVLKEQHVFSVCVYVKNSSRTRREKIEGREVSRVTPHIR